MKTYSYEEEDGQLFLVIMDGEAIHHKAHVADEEEGQVILNRYAEHGVEIKKA